MKNGILWSLGALALALTVSVAGLIGCGKVSDSPLSPLISPPVRYDFDSGIAPWVFQPEDSSQPAGFSVTPSTERTFRGSPGSLKLTLNFTATKQSYDFGIRALPMPSLTGKAMSAWVYWDSGVTGVPSKVIAKFYLKDAAWVYSSGPDATLAQGRWVQVTWPVGVSAEPANIKEWGMEIYTASGVSFTPGVMYVDNVAF